MRFAMRLLVLVQFFSVVLAAAGTSMSGADSLLRGTEPNSVGKTFARKLRRLAEMRKSGSREPFNPNTRYAKEYADKALAALNEKRALNGLPALAESATGGPHSTLKSKSCLSVSVSVSVSLCVSLSLYTQCIICF